MSTRLSFDFINKSHCDVAEDPRVVLKHVLSTRPKPRKRWKAQFGASHALAPTQGPMRASSPTSSLQPPNVGVLESRDSLVEVLQSAAKDKIKLGQAKTANPKPKALC